MSQERIEAAAKAAYVEYSQEPGFDAEAAWDDMGGTEDYETGIWALTAQAALAAADAVMFSDEAVEKVRGEIKHHLSPVIGWMALNAKDEEAAREHAAKFNERVELAVRAVIAALKGDA